MYGQEKKDAEFEKAFIECKAMLAFSKKYLTWDTFLKKHNLSIMDIWT